MSSSNGLKKTSPSNKPKAKPNLGAEKLTPEEQRRRFEALAEEAGCDETSDERFNEALAVLGKQKPKEQR